MQLPLTKDDSELRLAMIRLAKQYGCCGYMKATALLRIEGWRVNHKKVEKYAEAKEASLTKLAELSQTYEAISLTPQKQGRIFKQMQRFLDWCVREGELDRNPWLSLSMRAKPEVSPHGVLTDEQAAILFNAKDRVLHSALLFGLLTGMRSGEICGLMAEDITHKFNLGRFIKIRPNAIQQLKSIAAEREVPLHKILEYLLDTSLLKQEWLSPYLTVDAVVKRYARLKRLCHEIQGTVFHSTRKWFITQCERTGTL